MELEGRKELVDAGKSSRTWGVSTVSLRLAVGNVFQGFFGPKMAVFGPKLQLLKPRSATCESRSRPPPLSFLLKLCVIVLHTHRYHPPKFHPNLKPHDGVLIFPHFARAAACCLLLAAAAAAAAAAKPGRSTLDTKKGYKTKTGFTSSVNQGSMSAEPVSPANPCPFCSIKPIAGFSTDSRRLTTNCRCIAEGCTQQPLFDVLGERHYFEEDRGGGASVAQKLAK